MNFGFIKCATVTPEISVADISHNTEQIINLIENAESNGINLAVFPELCITSATCGDAFLSDTLTKKALKALAEIADRTAGLEITSVIGLPVKYACKVYNAAAVIHSGEILGIVPKTDLTINEKRYFTSGDLLGTGYNSISINEDIVPFSKNIIFRHCPKENFSFGVQIGTDLFSVVNTADALCAAGAQIIVNCAAINDTPQNENNIRLFTSAISAKLNCGYILANAGSSESTSDLIFSGQSIIAECGEILSEALPYSNHSITVTEIDVDKCASLRQSCNYPIRPDNFTDILFSTEIHKTELTRIIDRSPFEPKTNVNYNYEKMLTAAAYGLKKRIEHTNSKKMVLGISGGLDSTLALLICVRAAKLCNMPLTDIISVTMPCFGTTARTKSNAEILCEALGVTLKTVNIQNAVIQHFKDIGHDFSNHNVTYENSQARERTQILMDMANDVGGIVIGTGDLSELALGFATYNGDQMSMYGVNASIPKTLIRSLVAYEAINIGGKAAATLTDIINTPVSPELLPPDGNNLGQITEELVGPYELHDFFIYNFIKNKFSPTKIYRLAVYAFKNDYSNETILKWLKVFFKRFFSQQFKRSCMPDGAQVTDISFSPRGGLMLPSDISAKAFLEELENL